jgi:hypothetical protein
MFAVLSCRFPQHVDLTYYTSEKLMQTMFRLRANLDETRLALEARNNSLEKLQQSVLEKEQVCNIAM